MADTVSSTRFGDGATRLKKCQGDFAVIQHQEAKPMAFVCTIPAVATVQQDDATVRITRWDFEPGAVTGWHEHGWPYFVVMLVAGILRVHNGDQVIDSQLAAGQAYSRPAGIRHDVMNGSNHPIAFIEIELKRPEALVTKLDL